MEIFLIILLLYVIEIKFIMFMLCSLVFCVYTWSIFFLFIYFRASSHSLISTPSIQFFDKILFTLLIWVCLFIVYFFLFFCSTISQISVFSQYKDFTVGSRSPSALSYWFYCSVTCIWDVILIEVAALELPFNRRIIKK